MNPNVSPGISENPVKNELLSLIQGIRNIKNFSGTLQNLPRELEIIVQSLEGRGVNFNNISTLQGCKLLEELVKSFKHNFNGTPALLEEVSSVFPDAIQSTLDLSPEAQKIQEKFNIWLKNNEAYAREHNISENVEIKNDGIHLGGQVLRWKGHQFGKVSVQSDKDLEKQPYTIEQMGAMIQALGGETLKLENKYKLGGKEISSFLSEVANIELDRFYWSSSHRENNDHHAWGVNVGRVGVYVYWGNRHYVHSSFSSQN